MGELVVACECEFECDAGAFDSHDGHGAGHGSDGEVDNGVGSAVFGSDFVGHE